MNKINRLTGWEGRLGQWIAENRTRSFDRKTFDCVQATCDALFQVVGIDFAREVRGTYHDEESAKQAIKSLRNQSFHLECDRVFTDHGWLRITWRYAQRGDPVFFASKRDPEFGCLGFCYGTHALTPGDKGFSEVPMRLAVHCWHIPYVL